MSFFSLGGGASSCFFETGRLCQTDRQVVISVSLSQNIKKKDSSGPAKSRAAGGLLPPPPGVRAGGLVPPPVVQQMTPVAPPSTGEMLTSAVYNSHWWVWLIQAPPL